MAASLADGNHRAQMLRGVSFDRGSVLEVSEGVAGSWVLPRCPDGCLRETVSSCIREGEGRKEVNGSGSEIWYRKSGTGWTSP